MGSSSGTKKLEGQNYQSLQKWCVSAKKPFEDPCFPASDASLKFPLGHLPGPVEWKRPTEICTDPKLVVGRLNSSNITQGSLGNCWFVAACCALAKEKELWNVVVPKFESQDFKPSDPLLHGGLFCFRFWRFGRWVEVTIDDRLPTIGGQLIFAHSQLQNEFWCSLLEKAYAKLYGSYAAMEGGNLVDALIDFTAGFAERIDLLEDGITSSELKRIELFRHLRDEMVHHSLMCCAIKASSPDEMNVRTDQGLVKGHAYCITDVRKINIARTGLLSIFKDREKLSMVRLRNPWGEKEWTGPFSDGSVEWSKVSAKDRQKVGLTFQDDGEFWMTFEDFSSYFTDISLCYLINTSWFSFAKTWCESQMFSRWCVGPTGLATDRAGGCANNKETFLRNPQFCFDIKKDGEEFMVMVQQKDARGEKSLENKIHSIGFQILKVELNRKYRLHAIGEMTSSSNYIETRNIFHKCVLNQGKYVLVPTTFNPKCVGDFLLRVFSESNINLWELTRDVPKPPLFACLTGYCLATYCKIREGRNIREPNSNEACSPYFILFCEKSKAQSKVMKNSPNPKWNESATFYRKDSTSKLKIQVWSSRMLKDVLVSESELDIPVSEDRTTLEVILKASLNDNAAEEVGALTIEFLTSSDLASM